MEKKEILKAILEAAKKADIEVEVHEMKIDDLYKYLNKKEESLNKNGCYLKVEKNGEYYETRINNMNTKEVLASIGAIIEGVEKKAGIPRAVILSVLLQAVMED